MEATGGPGPGEVPPWLGATARGPRCPWLYMCGRVHGGAASAPSSPVRPAPSAPCRPRARSHSPAGEPPWASRVKLLSLPPQLSDQERLPIVLNSVLYGLPHLAIG